MSQYYLVLQSLHKARPSTTLYYKACTNITWLTGIFVCTWQQKVTTFMQPLHRDLQPGIPQAHRTTGTWTTTRCKTPRENRLRPKQSKPQRSKPQPPHTQATLHRRLQPLHTEKQKVSLSGFLPNTSPMQQSCRIAMGFAAVLSCDVMFCDVLSCDGLWCDVLWCDVLLCNEVLCGVMWWYVMWCILFWCNVVWCIVLWCIGTALDYTSSVTRKIASQLPLIPTSFDHFITFSGWHVGESVVYLGDDREAGGKRCSRRFCWSNHAAMSALSYFEWFCMKFVWHIFEYRCFPSIFISWLPVWLVAWFHA